MEDPEVSDGASENEYSDQDPDADVVKEGDDNSSMAEQKVKPETDENGKAVGGSTVTTTKPKLDPKDPLRPRRKKARRACFACQRAHLTCGMFSYSSDEEDLLLVLLLTSVNIGSSFRETVADLDTR